MKLVGSTRLTIDLKSDGVALSHFAYGLCRRIDRAGGPYRNKQVALDQAPADIVHAVGNLTEPNNIWTHAANDP